MTSEEARNLLVQTIVMWNNDPAQIGTVTYHFTNGAGLHVNWEDGTPGGLHYDDCALLSIWEPKEKP